MLPIDQHDLIFIDRVRRASLMSVEEKVLAGARLFDEVSCRMKDGIRMQFPDWSDEQIIVEFHRRLNIQRCLDEQGVITYSDLSRSTPPTGYQAPAW